MNAKWFEYQAWFYAFLAVFVILAYGGLPGWIIMMCAYWAALLRDFFTALEEMTEHNYYAYLFGFGAAPGGAE